MTICPVSGVSATAPLSEVTTTSVSRAMPSSSSLAVTRPTLWSTLSSIAAYAARSEPSGSRSPSASAGSRSFHSRTRSAGASIGVCTAKCDSTRKNGSPALDVEKRQRFLRESIGEVLAPLAVGEAREAIGIEEARRRGLLLASDRDVEPLARRAAGVAAEVPLADERGAVAARAQTLGDRHLVGGQPGRALRLGDLLHRGSGVGRRQRSERRRQRRQRMGEMKPRRALAGEERGSARRAHRRRGVGLGEAQALAGEAVEVRRAVVGVTVAREIEGAQIVDHDDDDARPLRQRATRSQPARRIRTRRAELVTGYYCQFGKSNLSPISELSDPGSAARASRGTPSCPRWRRRCAGAGGAAGRRGARARRTARRGPCASCASPP